MQRLWTIEDVGWDDIITNQIRDHWLDFQKLLIQLDRITVPRCILLPQYRIIQLHSFSDASKNGFGCVLYLRVTDNHHKQQIRMICA